MHNVTNNAIRHVIEAWRPTVLAEAEHQNHDQTNCNTPGTACAKSGLMDEGKSKIPRARGISRGSTTRKSKITTCCHVTA